MINNFDTLQKQGQENFENAVRSMTAVANGCQEIAKESADYSRRQLETSSAAAKEFVGVKSWEKLSELQAAYARRYYETFVAQATRMGELYADTAKKAYAPLESMMPKTGK
jgi:hypothetical protein